MVVQRQVTTYALDHVLFAAWCAVRSVETQCCVHGPADVPSSTLSFLSRPMFICTAAGPSGQGLSVSAHLVALIT